MLLPRPGQALRTPPPPQNSYCTAYLESGRYRDLYIDFVFQLAVLCFMPMRAACLQDPLLIRFAP